MKNNNNRHAALASLAGAAMALPAINVQAASVADNFQIGVRHHAYQEEGIDSNKLQQGSAGERYDIDVNQFQLIAPLSDSFQLDVNYQVEKMSGASPYFTQKNADGQVVQVMSGASIEDTRKDSSAKLTYVADNYSLAAVIARSTEDDYESSSYGIELSYELADKLTTLNLAADQSQDEISPTFGVTSPSVNFAEKDSWSVYAGLTRVLNKNMQLQVGLGLIDKSGFLSDPYKIVVPGSGQAASFVDTRPTERQATTLSTRLRYFIPEVNAALHADYRYYDDDWQINSHTFELAWYQNLADSWQVVPSLRFYSQSQAYFYENFYEVARSDGLQSTDYRLSSYGAITLGLNLYKQIGNWRLTAGYQTYNSDESYALDSGEGSVGLIDFDMLSLGFDVKF
ncbi:hypothetical protein C2869_20985 [Saccharobesus litoralis]|uniref:DUF3570 domain-containing protein n=1 Tax=Saccharobesus litoralis TaxID=2172099 RepID=A0A2S0VWX1_9ALTE|nr:DUF3570 domain-containing protein [Saccharobesus litoralis]AWB68717.1 hypothetical protein C2869_20985 [Saccharobesus litoralis]